MKFLLILLLAALSSGVLAADKNTLLNVSFDVARELYEKYNQLFIADYQQFSFFLFPGGFQ